MPKFGRSVHFQSDFHAATHHVVSIRVHYIDVESMPDPMFLQGRNLFPRFTSGARRPAQPPVPACSGRARSDVDGFNKKALVIEAQIAEQSEASND